MTFENWLKQFKNSDSAIGDLARDFIRSKCRTIKSSFEIHPPCKEAEETYKIAKTLYNEHRKEVRDVMSDLF